MKSAYIGGALLCLFFMFTTNVEATEWYKFCYKGGNCEVKRDYSCDKAFKSGYKHESCSVIPTATLRPTLSPSPTGTPYVTSSPSPTATPSATPTVSPTTIPEATSTASPETTPGNQRTDLSDGRSDGRTESLGCLRPEDNCSKVASAQTNVPRELPQTGGNELLGNIIIGLIGIWLGFKIKSFVDGNQI